MKKAVNEEEKQWMKNRDKKLRPKPGLFWCDCDRNHVSAWQKCEVCNSRTGKRCFKK
jgi:hypothetical protein